jgi:hypothetical protein
MKKQNALTCFTLTCAFLFVFIPAISGQETATPAMTPEKRALIAEFLDIIQTRKVAMDVYREMIVQQRKISSDVITRSMETKSEYKELSEVDREKVRKEILDNSERTDKRVYELLEARLDFPTLMENISYQLYDKYFTEQELKDLVGFYRSPAGKKSIEVGPKLFSESMELTRISILPMMNEVIDIMAKEESERLSRELEEIKSQQPAAKPRPTRRRSAKSRRP